MRTFPWLLLLSALSLPFAIACNSSDAKAPAIRATDPLCHDGDGGSGPGCLQGTTATCVRDLDCNGGVCASGGRCALPVGINGVRDGDETDVDCGGAQSPTCADDRACITHANCASQSCQGGRCAAARADDGIRNGDETDVDCGGSTTQAPRCATDKLCVVAADCASGGCGYKKACVARPSCAGHYGGDTCGEGEPDDPTAKPESCCASRDLPMPSKPVLMDKFHITAGRYRAFLDAVNGNVRGYIQDHRPTGWDPTWDAFVPNGWDVDANIQGGDESELRRLHSSVWHQLGGSGLLWRLGRDGLPFRYGCFIEGNGTHTYRMPDAVQVDILKDIPHKYSQEVLDAKALNCVTALMLMAFCEWDWPGSRLPTYAETRFAWHAGDPSRRKFPWGNTPAPLGYLYPGDVFGPNSGKPDVSGRYGPDAVVPNNAEGIPGDPSYANWKYNYAYPAVPFPETFFPDFSAYLSAPGRFPNGNGPFGHADLAGNIFDLTSTIAGAPGDHPDDRELTWGRNGAWEGHEIPFASESGPWTAPIMRKYGKAGGRCVRGK